MRNKYPFILVCVFLLVFSSAALGAEGFYVGLNAGFDYLNDATVHQSGVGNTVEAEFDTGQCFSGVFGYDFGAPRVEGEIAYITNDIDKLTAQGTIVDGSGEASSWSFMLNAYLEVENRTAFTPYFGGGIGIADVSVENIIISNYNLVSESDTAFAYNFTAGIAWEIKEPITLDLRYRYFATQNPELGAYEIEYGLNMVTLGFRYTFK